MKRTTVLYLVCLGASLSMACSQGGGVTPVPPGGTAGAPAMTQAGSGGAPVGPSAGSAGAPTVSGGAPTTTGGSGPAVGGASGAPPAAGAAGAVVAAGSGGQPGAGGTDGGGAGAATVMGGTGGVSPETIVPDLQGYYWEGTCAGTIAVEGHNCPLSDNNSSCPANGIDRSKSIPVKGVTGQLYQINIEVRGVIGTRCYTGGTRASTAALNENGNNNWWYSGGTYANPTGWWNTYELHVSPSTGEAPGDVFYFNGSGIQGGSDCEREATYVVNYKASFKVKGGGMITFKLHDQNCKGQQNCGSNPDGSTACAPRTVDLTGMAATPPSTFTQPPSNSTWKPQWMFIAVTSVTTAQ